MQNSDSLEDFAAELAKEIEALEQAQAAGLESGGQHNAGLSATSLGGHGLPNSAGLKISSAPAPMALSAAHLSTYLAPPSTVDQRIAKLRIIKNLVESQMAPSSSADAYHYYASQALKRGQPITASFMTIAQTEKNERNIMQNSAGIAENKAAIWSQRQRLNRHDAQIKQLQNESRDGTAMSMALGKLDLKGESSMAMGISYGHFRGKDAPALGMASRLNNTVYFDMGLAYGSHHDQLGYAASMSWRW